MQNGLDTLVTIGGKARCERRCVRTSLGLSRGVATGYVISQPQEIFNQCLPLTRGKQTLPLFCMSIKEDFKLREGR